jgi:hypothetical protein
LRGLDPRIHTFVALEGVDGRARPGQDEVSRPISSVIQPQIFSDSPAVIRE